MTSLDIYVLNIISLDNYSILEFSIDYVKSKDNILDSLTKELNKELVEKSLSGIRLKPIEWKVYYEKKNPT